MTTTENTRDRSITLPLSEVTFLLSIATDKLEEGERLRYESISGVVADTDMPLDGMPQSEVFLLMKRNAGYDDEIPVRAYADEAEAIKIMKILNEFSSDHFEVQSIAYER